MTAAYIPASYPYYMPYRTAQACTTATYAGALPIKKSSGGEKLSNDALYLQMLDRILIHPHDVSEYFIGVLA